MEGCSNLLVRVIASPSMLPRRNFMARGLAALTAGGMGACRSATPGPTSPSGPEDPSWAEVRACFLKLDSVTFLNNASQGMPPGVVLESVKEGFSRLSEDPLGAKHDLQEVIRTRSIPGLARLLGADPDELFLARNATEPLHLQAVGLELEAGDEVLITSQEHPAGRNPWLYRAAREGIAVREVFVPSPFADPGEVVERIGSAMTPRTRAIAFCHVTRGGHLYPVKELCAMARERGVVSVVDGAQAVGMFGVDLHDLGCDAYAASLHKWLLGPMGTGVGYVRRESRGRWLSSFDADARAGGPGYAPAGTVDLPLRAALASAVDFMERIGLEAVADRDRHLSNHLKAGLSGLPSARLVSGPTRETSAPGSTIFVLEGVDPIEAVAALDARGLHIDEHARDGHPALRISTHFYNTTEELDRVLEALRGLA